MSETITLKLETERLVLRNMSSHDVSQDYVDWLNEPEINKYLSCSNTLQTMESCFAYVQSYEGRKDKALFGIFLKDEGLHIGNLTFSEIDWRARVGTIGISVGRTECMGRGYGREALSAVMNYSFRELNLHRLQAGVVETNLNSLKLFLGCGFRVEGLLRDYDMTFGKSQTDDKHRNAYILGIIGTDLSR